MTRFRCPECGREEGITPTYGGEIVSVDCLEHTGGADAHARPVYMVLVAEAVMAVEPSPLLA
jgi:hypothetical protein